MEGSSARGPFRVRQVIALVLGVAFLIGAAAPLVGYAREAGLDGYLVLGLVALANMAWVLWLLVASRSVPARAGGARRAVAAATVIAAFFSPVVLLALGYREILLGMLGAAPAHQPADGLLAVCGVFLLLALIAAAVGARGARSRPTTATR